MAAIEWNVDADNVVLMTLNDDWRWETLYDANKAVASVIRASGLPGYVLIDYTRTRNVPTGGFITHMRNMIGIYPENAAMMIFVTQNMLVQRLLTIFQSTYQADLGKKVRVAANFDDAQRMIERHRTTHASIPE
jgi:hypothetical protein